MNEHLLPLQAFFKVLQQHPDFSLGVAEYEVMLLVLQQNPDKYLSSNHDPNKPSPLFRLCKLLWLKPNQNEQLFKKLFDKTQNDFSLWVQRETEIIEQAHKQDAKTEQKISSEQIDKSEAVNEPQNNAAEQNKDVTQPHITPTPHATTNPSAELPPLYLNFQEGSSSEKFANQTLMDKSLLLVRNYVPFQQRQFIQIWRRLKDRSGEAVATNEIDLNATVQKMNREGFLLTPVYKKRTQSKAGLITFIDHKGSMVAFKHWTETIANTALNAGISNHVYYFRNVPQPYNTGNRLLYVYSDKGQINHISLKKVFEEHPNAAVLIISDAGTASGSYNMSRIEATEVFLRQVYNHTLKVAWLNPMPENRWNGSSAYIIRELTNMFEASPEGLQKAMPLLKGKQQPRSPIVFPELLKEL